MFLTAQFLRTTTLEFVAAFSAVTAIIFLLQPFAAQLGLVDRPGGRKDHAAPTPVTGGLAIAVGTILPALLLTPPNAQVIGLGVAAVILVVIGVLDDIYDIPWPVRVLAQTAAALAIILIGDVRVENIGPAFGLGPLDLGYLSIPFTLAATVGLINALNMADGIDGLAGSLCLCTVAMLVAASIYAGNADLANGLTVIAGAVTAYLAFNIRLPWRKRALIFLGNSGSAYLGLVIAWAVFRLTQNPVYPVTPVLAPFLIAPPVIDCLVLIVRRLLHKQSPFHADRTHAHHLMLDGGFSVTGVVMTLCALSLTLGLGAALALRADVPQPLLVAVFGLITVGYFLFTRHPDKAIAAYARLTGAFRRG
ncbi:MAG: undecaprenyl/decaprenyl-phosphate alpha-N-acetylglucosaminyl 1-phosphate transferase [Caulobacter sp.]|nr:undecaprenyl/decaprenyl-phosphate alpha-N-acetylglucosaminyl 1-phosphate transferase [Caulobacter sp.]